MFLHCKFRHLANTGCGPVLWAAGAARLKSMNESGAVATVAIDTTVLERAWRGAAWNIPNADVRPGTARRIGTFRHCTVSKDSGRTRTMHEIIYLIGLVVVVMFLLGLVGVR